MINERSARHVAVDLAKEVFHSGDLSHIGRALTGPAARGRPFAEDTPTAEVTRQIRLAEALAAHRRPGRCKAVHRFVDVRGAINGTW